MGYYVYVFVDPRKPGSFRYKGVDLVFRFKPYYVGKGKGERCASHFKPYILKHDKNRFKANTIKKIQQAGYDCLDYILKLKMNLTDQEACELEIKTIASIGRCGFGGSLTNMTDGGTGGAIIQSLPNRTEIEKRRIAAVVKLNKARTGIKLGSMKDRHIRNNGPIKGIKTYEMEFQKRGQAISRAKLGTKYNKKHRKAISESLKGRKIPLSVIVKRSETTRRKHAFSTETQKRILDMYINEKLGIRAISRKLKIIRERLREFLLSREVTIRSSKEYSNV